MRVPDHDVTRGAVGRFVVLAHAARWADGGLVRERQYEYRHRQYCKILLWQGISSCWPPRLYLIERK